MLTDWLKDGPRRTANQRANHDKWAAAAGCGLSVAVCEDLAMAERELELRDRLLAPIAIRDNDGNVVGANLGALVRRLVLFEQVVIDSYAMRELPALIETIGTGPFIDLLESGAVLIRADGWTYGEIGNGGLVPGRGAAPLPLLQYSFAPLVPHDREHHIKLSLGSLREMPLGRRTSQKVRNAIVDSLLRFPDDAGRESLEALPRDLTRNLNLVYGATAQALTRKLGVAVDDTSFELRIEQVDDDVFAADTDIAQRFDLTDEETDKVVQDGLLAICGLNQRLEEIKAYGAIIGFRDAELPLAQEKLSFLIKEVDPEAQEQRFDRVVTLAGLPDPETAEGAVDIEKLLEARETEEIREFRHWLRTLDDVSDDEVRERVESTRAKLAPAIHGGAGKTIRLITTTGVGFIPVVGPIAGIALSAADQFLLEKLLPEPGPVSFIGSTYNSIFK